MPPRSASRHNFASSPPQGKIAGVFQIDCPASVVVGVGFAKNARQALACGDDRSTTANRLKNFGLHCYVGQADATGCPTYSLLVDVGQNERLRGTDTSAISYSDRDFVIAGAALESDERVRHGIARAEAGDLIRCPHIGQGQICRIGGSRRTDLNGIEEHLYGAGGWRHGFKTIVGAPVGVPGPLGVTAGNVRVPFALGEKPTTVPASLPRHCLSGGDCWWCIQAKSLQARRHSFRERRRWLRWCLQKGCWAGVCTTCTPYPHLMWRSESLTG